MPSRMVSASRPLIVGNWKMNGLSAALSEAKAMALSLTAEPAAADVVICPPTTLIAGTVRAVQGSAIAVGGQDCHSQAAGAFTGEISAEMLADAGVALVILGHSERRKHNGENNALVAAKTEGALRAGLIPIVCIGENRSQRDAGEALSTIEAQLEASAPDGLARSAFAIAYEPCWAIGTGVTPTLDEIAQVHALIRARLVARFGETGRQAPILYGGSVNGANCGEILKVAEVGGTLVGGASLRADDFLEIVRSA
jgi:triosephosphate isomerase